MSYVTTYTEDQLNANAIAILADVFPGRALHPLSFLGQEAASCSQLLAAVEQGIAEADRDAVPITQVVSGILQSRCSSDRLDQWAEFFGLPSNQGPGVYGRNAATAATGGAGTATGRPGVTVASGTQLTDPSGQVTLQLVTGFTLGSGGSLTGVSIVAVTTGPSGNLAVNTPLTWQAPPAGLAPQLILTAALTGGYDSESDIDLVLRLLRRMQQPPKGGTANDWRTWAEAATNANGVWLGIARAYILGRRNGTLSVDVCVTIPGQGTGRDPGATIASEALTYLLGQKVVTDSVRVVRPNFVSGEALSILLDNVQPASPAYAWDWDDSSSTGTFGPTTTATMVILGATMPASLKAAVDNGTQPRLQLGVAGQPTPVTAVKASGLVELPRVLSYVENSPAGKCTLTMDAAPSLTIADDTTILAGSGLVIPVCAAIASMVNGLGPSRRSGYADPLDLWQSDVTIASITRAALDARDVNGSPVCGDINQVGQGMGVQIQVGSNPVSAADYLVYDNNPTLGPQIALLSLVQVRQH